MAIPLIGATFQPSMKSGPIIKPHPKYGAGFNRFTKTAFNRVCCTDSFEVVWSTSNVCQDLKALNPRYKRNSPPPNLNQYCPVRFLHAIWDKKIIKMFIFCLTNQIKNFCRLVINYNYNKELRQKCAHSISLKRNLTHNLILDSSNLCKKFSITHHCLNPGDTGH
jgi:hypothetical protein